MLEPARIQRWIQALESGNDASRREAITALQDVDSAQWPTAPRKNVASLAEALERMFANEAISLPLRQNAVVLVGKLGPAAAVAISGLADLLVDSNSWTIREAAAAALGQLGPDARSALDPLIRLLTDNRPSLVMQAVRTLVAVGGDVDRVRTALTNLWQTANLMQGSRIEVALALCKLKVSARGIVPFLTTTAAANGTVAERRAAMAALAFCERNDPDVVPVLIRAALSDKDEDVRQIAEASLAQLRLTRPKALHACAKQLANSEYAEAALRGGGPLSVPALVELLEGDDPAIKEKAARLLGSLGEAAQPAVPLLTQSLRASDRSLRLAVAKALWNITQNAAMVTPELVGMLSEKWPSDADSEDARRRHLQTVIEALWRIGAPAELAVPALLAKSKDANRLVSESAVTALRAIAPSKAPPLRR